MAATAAEPIEAVFRALADPTRRQVVERLSRGPASVSELARRFEMALPSFVQHLGVLEASGLVRSAKRGRVRTYELTPARLDIVDDWLARQRAVWGRRLDQFDEYASKLKESQDDVPHT